MVMYGCLWLCMAMYSYVWLCMVMYGYGGSCMAMEGHVWLCSVIYGFLLELILKNMVGHFVTHKQVKADKQHPI